MKEFVIDRSKWLRGEGPAESYLLRASDGRMCCLGIYLEACGVSPTDLRSKKSPTTCLVPKEHPVFELDLPQLVTVNDSFGYEDAERETVIAECFARREINVRFMDGPAPQ